MNNFIKTLVTVGVLTNGLSYAEEATRENVTKLYVATFDRAPDKAGLDYWVNANMPLEDISTSFFDQPETKALYPDGFSDYDFILATYKNLFKRDPDEIGGDYWEQELASNNISKSNFILAIVNGAKDEDATILKNKTDVGLKFVESGSNDTEMAKSIMVNVTSNTQTVVDSYNTIYKIINNNTTIVNNYYISSDGTIESKDQSTVANDSTETDKESSNTEEPIKNTPPTAKISMSSVLSSYKFDGRDSSDSDGKIEKYQWKDSSGSVISSSPFIQFIGDSIYDDISNTGRPYSAPTNGVFKITLTVTDDKGAIDTTSIDISDEIYKSEDEEYPTDVIDTPSTYIEGVYEDLNTGLMWQDNTEVGVQKQYILEPQYYVYNFYETSGDTAETYCSDLTLGNYYDWRLPTKEEFTGDLIDKFIYNHLVGDYWTSSVDYDLTWWDDILIEEDPDGYLKAQEGGSVYIRPTISYLSSYPVSKISYAYVRCVRDM